MAFEFISSNLRRCMAILYSNISDGSLGGIIILDTGTYDMIGNHESRTFHPTCNDLSFVKEAHEEAMREVERLDTMMLEVSLQAQKEPSFQQRQVRQAKHAGFKHKKPHMNRRIIR